MGSIYTNGGNEPSDNAGSFQPGTMIGPHKVVKNLGTDWAGTTLLAESSKIRSKRCICEVLPPEFAATPDASQHFQDILQPRADIDHPNNVKINSYGNTDGHFWIKTEYIEGIDTGTPGRPLLTLADYAKLYKNKIPEEELLEAVDTRIREHIETTFDVEPKRAQVEQADLNQQSASPVERETMLHMTYEDLCVQRLGIPSATATRHLAKLGEEGELNKEGAGRATHYRPTEPIMSRL